jgi:hypothetical protein
MFDSIGLANAPLDFSPLDLVAKIFYTSPNHPNIQSFKIAVNNFTPRYDLQLHLENFFHSSQLNHKTMIYLKRLVNWKLLMINFLKQQSNR